MQPPVEKGVPQGERAMSASPRILPDWDSAKIFLTVVREGSFRAAAGHLNQSINVLRRRVNELEHTLGVTVFTRHVNGVRITPEGEKLLIAAQRMESASYDLIRAREQFGPSVAGEVRLAVTEGLGTYWIAPRLIEFQRANPNLLVDLNCAMKSADVSRLEADVAVQITRPKAPDMQVVKLGRLHFMFFAAKSYLDIFGTPRNADDLKNHRILIQTDENARWRQLYDRLFPNIPAPGLVALRTNVSSAHYWSIIKGAGIGVLPTYAHILGASLVPLDLDVHETVDVWLTYHPDVKRIVRVRRLIDWIIQSFSPQRFPWFRDGFVHPKDFARTYKGGPLGTITSGFEAHAANP